MPNKFISVLSSIGHGFKIGVEKAIALETKLLPTEIKVGQEAASVLTLVDPAAGVTLGRILSVVGGIEQITTAVNASTGNGQAKLAVALPIAEKVILSDPIFAGKQIGDLDKFNKALEGFVSSFVDLVDSVESVVATAEAPAAPAPLPSAPAPATPAVPVAA